MSEEIKKGLLGIVVDETTISHVVPELSALTYRGYKVQDLCDKCDFEEVAYLVLHGELPSKTQLKKFVKDWNGNGGNLVLITHYIIIGSVTDVLPRSGEVVITDKNFKVLSTIRTN